MRIKPEVGVLPREKLQPGNKYLLAQLPDAVRFLFRGRRYRTLTFPPYRLVALNCAGRRRRECYCETSHKAVMLIYAAKVKVV